MKQLPAMHCRGLCVDQCTTVPMNAAEVTALQNAAGRQLDVYPNGIGDRQFTLTETWGKTCPVLNSGRCSGYEGRPMLCRLFGMTKAMRCQHGCEPDRWLSDLECAELLDHPLPPEAEGALTAVTEAIRGFKR